VKNNNRGEQWYKLNFSTSIPGVILTGAVFQAEGWASRIAPRRSAPRARSLDRR
jgi:hypothetical protein